MYFHFHEIEGKKPQIIDYQECDGPEWGKKYTLVELTMEAARAKVMNDVVRYKQIRPILLEHRITIEAELRKRGKGMNPPPHVVMEKLI